jgi:hypothetical protein
MQMPTIHPAIRVASHAVAIVRLPLDAAAVVLEEVRRHIPGQRAPERSPASVAPVAPEPIVPDPAAPPTPTPVPSPGPADPGTPGPGTPGPGPEPVPEPAPVGGEAETGEAFVTEPTATSRADAHGDGGIDPREVDSWREAADEVVAEDLGTPVYTSESGEEPDNVVPLLDGGTAKSVRTEAERMAKAADPDV